MILQGNARGGAKNLALHLMKDENDHVEIHEIRGFVSDDLVSALREAEAVSKGTRAKKYLFSLSLNPPAEERVPVQIFETAIKRVENTLGLENQPRTIVFHEKSDGRRHCHAVWSRINTDEMKAIPLPYSKLKLMEISRELYIEHGWKMPEGMISKEKRSLENFTLAEWQQAKRIGKDSKALKRTIQECWSASNSQAKFAQLVKDRGYILAKGDRRGVVLIDKQCEVLSLSRWAGVRAKQVREKIKDQDNLPSVEKTKQSISQDMTNKLDTLKEQQNLVINTRRKGLAEKHKALKLTHQKERNKRRIEQELRKISEIKARQERYNTGLRGLIDRFNGKHRKIKLQNKQDTLTSTLRDQQEMDGLRYRQLSEKKTLFRRVDRLKQFKEASIKNIDQDKTQFQEISKGQKKVFKYKQAMGRKKQENNRILGY